MRLLIALILISIAQIANSQNRYWVWSSDSASTAQLIKSRLNTNPVFYSNWLKAFSVTLSDSQTVSILKTDGQLKHKKVKTFAISKVNNNPSKLEPSVVIRQINGHSDVIKPFDGKGVKVGVADAGFLGAQTNNYTSHLFASQKIMGYKDFVDSGRISFFSDSVTGLDNHGTSVLTRVAGLNQSTQAGMAIGAHFYLARTDHGTNETRTEEDNLVAALEYFYNEGCKVVNISLGYALGFDDTEENHQLDELNGKSMLAKAIDTAVLAKNMVVIVAAGNEGENHDWQGYISIPADAASALAVGATVSDLPLKTAYSGRGFEKLPFVKPDVVCFSLTGTSFSAPIIAGLAAVLVQAFPNKSAKTIIDAIRFSANFAAVPNNYIGYGVPNAELAYRILETDDYIFKPNLKPKKVTVKSDVYNIKLKTNQSTGVIFHKMDKRNVLDQELRKNVGKTLIITRPTTEIKFSTIYMTSGELYEIEWPSK